MLIPLIFVWYFYKKWLNDKYEIAYATFRMLLQLILIGYVLIFIFEDKHLYIGILVLSFMLIVSVFIIFRNTKDKSLNHFFNILLSTFLSFSINLFFIVFIVLDISYFYEPRYIIPLAGMIFANGMNVISLAIERFEKENLKLDNFEEARNISFKVSMIPQINALLAVGLVALPGMMTGQILSGIDPLIAVRYQIMIMIMSISSGGMSIIFYFLLLKRQLNHK